MNWIDELRRLLGRSDDRGHPEGDSPAEVSCREAAEHVFEWLDGELDPELEAEVGPHLETCARCSPLLVFERSFQEALARVTQDEAAPDELRREIMASLRTEGFGSRTES